MGITTAIVGKDYSGIGFAIPSNTAKQVCAAILASGHVDRGYVGMALRALEPDAPVAGGAEVVAVEPKSPAALAEIEAGDVIVGFDGEEVTDPAELVLMLTRAAVGADVMFDVVRNGDRRTITVRVGRRPRDG
jgi:S1-C subfamily serine protease